MSRIATRPYLITKSESSYSLTVRETRYNSQGYPLVSETLCPESFKTANAARAFAKEQFGAEAGQFETKTACA